MQTLKVQPPTFTFHGEGAKPIVTLHPDGRVELGQGFTLDDATLAFWKGVEAAGFERLNAEIESLRASLTRVEEERDARDQAAIEAVEFIGVMRDEMTMAGYPAGDRTVLLANFRNVLTRLSRASESDEGENSV